MKTIKLATVFGTAVILSTTAFGAGYPNVNMTDQSDAKSLWDKKPAGEVSVGAALEQKYLATSYPNEDLWDQAGGPTVTELFDDRPFIESPMGLTATSGDGMAAKPYSAGYPNTDEYDQVAF